MHRILPLCFSWCWQRQFPWRMRSRKARRDAARLAAQSSAARSAVVEERLLGRSLERKIERGSPRALTFQIPCTGGRDEAWIGIGTFASRGIQGATYRTDPRRRSAIGQTRR